MIGFSGLLQPAPLQFVTFVLSVAGREGNWKVERRNNSRRYVNPPVHIPTFTFIGQIEEIISRTVHTPCSKQTKQSLVKYKHIYQVASKHLALRVAQ